jgi:hypothetical protein
MKPKIALLILFLITTFVGQAFGQNASGDFWFDVTDEGVLSCGAATRGRMPVGIPSPMLLVYYYVSQPGFIPPAKIIQFPIVVDNQWSGKVSDRGVANWIGKTTVESRTQIIPVPAGTFSNCLKLKTEITLAAGGPSTDFMSGTRYMWFAPGVGLIKVEYYHGNGKVTKILLKEYEIGRMVDEGDYFPLNKGMEWRYEWHNGYYDSIVEEECYTTGKRKLPEQLGGQEVWEISCANELSGRTTKGWPPKILIFEGVDSRDKLSTTWGYIKRAF